MSQPVPSPSTDAAPLQSDRTECTGCECAIRGVYYDLNQRPLCPACRAEMDEAMKGGSESQRLLTAAVSGFGAALVGALVCGGVGLLTSLNSSILAILSGGMVGLAVFHGSDSRGGRRNQVLAVVLTYLSVAASLSPELYTVIKAREDFKAFHAASHALDSSQVEPVDEVAQTFTALARTSVWTPAMPVLVGIDQPMSWLSYGVALFVAWLRNRKAKLNIAGPFNLAEARAEP